MRFLLPLLLLAAVCSADEIDAELKKLEVLRPEAFTLSARARTFPVVDRLVESHDPRVVLPLATFVVETLGGEERLFEEQRGIRRQEALAKERSKKLQKQLGHLLMRERAGAKGLGPQIERRRQELAQQDRLAFELSQNAAAIDGTVGYVRDLREKLVAGLGTVTAALEGPAAAEALADVRRTLGLEDRTRALLLVRVLRDCRRPEAEPHLVAALRSGDMGVARAAVPAVARLRTPAGANELLALAERDAGGPVSAYVLHILGMEAGHRFTSLDQAREWAAGLG